MAIGKITGQMLGDSLGNLDRDGVDLAFDTDLIYLDVNNRRVGIRTSSPAYDLDVNGTTRTTNLEVTNSANISAVTIIGNNIFSNTGVLNLAPSTGSQIVYQNKLLIDDIQIEGNSIRTINSNANLELTANGTGTINLNSNVEIFGNLHATGTITADGNLTLGDANTDNITFNAEVASDIIPDIDNTYKLGNALKRWNDVWVKDLYASSINTGDFILDGIDIALETGNTIYVASNGSSGNSGTHPQDPVDSVGRAIDLATAGDTIYIYPGTYSETLPLIVPAGVTIKGAGIRSVTIQPDSDDTVDMFLLNGECTIEDLTITGFKFDSGTNTGYAFKFAPGMTVTSRSPYIRNVTVITQGSVTSGTDPRGFDTGDAGRGAYLDGSIVNAASNEAACLFHSVTFICPGVDVLTCTNGVRVEWLNCFTYFADRSIYAFGSSSGFAGNGKTRIKISNKTGTFNVGNTLSYYDVDGTTVLASGLIESIDGDFYVIDGRVLGFERLTDRDPKTVFANGNAALSTAQKKFGTASLSLDGTGDYAALLSQADFEFGTGDFTLEAWVRTAASGTYTTIFDMRSAAATEVAIAVGLDNVNRFYCYINGAIVIQGTTSISNNVWVHVALSRSGTSLKLFLNGAQESTTYTDSNNYADKPFRIGADYAAGFGFNGYIDDVRVCKGAAKYTASFTVPTSALTGDNSTVLLLHFDGPNGSTTFFDDGVTLQDVRTSAGGTASIIDFADYSDFGAEIRSIASASVYGNYGIYGDGDGVVGYFISHNMGYIGSGKLSNNDPTFVPEDSTNVNEVVENNNAQIYYTTVDHKGDFRVGEFFYVNQRDGTVTFDQSDFTITSSTGITFTDGSNLTELTPTYVQTGNIKISGNTIESIVNGVTLTAANNQITATSNVTVTGTLTIDDNFTVSGNSVIGDSNTDTTTFNSEIISNFVPNVTTTYNLGSQTNQWNKVFLAEANIDDIQISGNLIRTTVSNSNLELRASGAGSIRIDNLDFKNNTIVTNTTNTDLVINPNGTGKIKLEKDTDITGNLSVTGNITLGGNIQIGNQSSDTVNVVGSINNNLIPNVNGLFDIGSSTLTWRNLYAANLQINDIEINDNYIRTITSNADLELSANGTGVVRVTTSNLSVNQNFTVSGTSTLNNTNVTGLLTTNNLIVNNTVTSSKFTTGDIEIQNNVIRTVNSNSNLELRTSGTGAVYIENLSVQQSTISGLVSGQDIELTPAGLGIVKINSTQSLQIPVGTDLQRPAIPSLGMIRYNSTINQYEGYNGTYWVQLGGVIDLDRDTYVIPEITPGANDNTIYFITGGQQAATLTATEFAPNKLIVDDLEINGNVIQTLTSNTDIELRPNGTGALVIDGFRFTTNTLLNTNNNAITEFRSTGTGYYKIVGTNAVRIPSGISLQRPLVPQTGMVRFNTEFGFVEVYDGVVWNNIAGVLTGITFAQAEDIAFARAVTFG